MQSRKVLTPKEALLALGVLAIEQKTKCEENVPPLRFVKKRKYREAASVSESTKRLCEELTGNSFSEMMREESSYENDKVDYNSFMSMLRGEECEISEHSKWCCEQLLGKPYEQFKREQSIAAVQQPVTVDDIFGFLEEMRIQIDNERHAYDNRYATY
jgi:hypothetical protein